MSDFSDITTDKVDSRVFSGPAPVEINQLNYLKNEGFSHIFSIVPLDESLLAHASKIGLKTVELFPKQGVSKTREEHVQFFFHELAKAKLSTPNGKVFLHCSAGFHGSTIALNPYRMVFGVYTSWTPSLGGIITPNKAREMYVRKLVKVARELGSKQAFLLAGKELLSVGVHTVDFWAMKRKIKSFRKNISKPKPVKRKPRT